MIRATHAKSPDCLSKVIMLSCCHPSDAPGYLKGKSEPIEPVYIADNEKAAAIYMAVANQVNRLVNGASERIMSVFSGLHIVEAEGSNATPQVPSSQRMRPHTMHLPVRILDSPRSRLYSKTVHAKKGMTDITDVFHLGRNIHQDHEAHRHLLQNHPRLIRVPK